MIRQTLGLATLTVSHLGGIEVGFRLSSKIDVNKPTVVLFNPFTTTADYYLPELENKRLTDGINLIAIEPLGHGKTNTLQVESFTYWDSAIMSLQLLDALGINKVFALGTSQGGWIAARMALLAPNRIQGIILLGSSMDSESPRSRELGCWNGVEACAGLVDLADDLTPVPEFEPGDGYYDFLMEIGYGKAIDPETKEFWVNTIRSNYNGAEGKKKICMAAVTLAGRDGLRERLPFIKCPVLWIQGSDDVVFSVAQAREDISRFTNSVETKLIPCEEGVHFLSKTHRRVIQEQLLNFVFTWNSPGRALL